MEQSSVTPQQTLVSGETGPDDAGLALRSVSIRPILRGRVHQVAFLASVIGLIWLVTSAPNTKAMVAAWVYGIAMLALYLTSSSYHVFARSTRARELMQRADHSMIYILIAGTYTPVCLLALSGMTRWVLLSIVWVGAAIGIAMKLGAFAKVSRLGTALYLVLGWAAILAVPSLLGRPALLVGLGAGGILYTVGAILFGVRRPKLSPRWFGYHEVWHVLGTAAGVCLFTVNLTLIRAG